MRHMLALSCLLPLFCAQAQMPLETAPPPLTVAAAANLADAIEAIDGEFMAKNPGTVIKVSTGASGNFYAQIKNGAPFDVFVSADMDFPSRLTREGAALETTLTEYAIGRLALWTTNPDVDLTPGIAAVTTPQVRKLAIANPDTAPYGRAAREALTRSGIWDELLPKIVSGENIAQTAQFVQTGNADAGFVAYSTLMSPKLQGKGRYWLVPSTLYAPLEQGAVVTTRGAAHPLARRYVEFLRSGIAQAIFDAYGYAPPTPPAHDPVSPATAAAQN